MNTFKECLAEDYSDAINRSFDKLLGKLNQEGNLARTASYKRFPKIAESPESKNIMNTFRTALG
jgi:hypothetical protein